MNTPPLALYLHMPWCVQKCPYCDFNSHSAAHGAPTSRYIQALLADLDNEADRAGDRIIETVFIGGGTPSLFSPEEVHDLLNGVRNRFVLAEDAEITMEANPGTVECGAPKGYRDAGVNRLSIGAQTFDDDLLAVLGRIHSVSDIQRTFAAARKSGFDNINIDVMHGLPGQSVARALDDLEAVVMLQPEHVSWYQLTLEPNTVFYSRPPANLPSEDLEIEIQEHGRSFLADHGYGQYEVSAYARDGRRCRHNINYWQFGDYLAAGAGAHGKFSVAGVIYRYQKSANPQQYMLWAEGPGSRCNRTELSANDRLFEFMLNALRLTDGFSESMFAERTGLTPEILDAATTKAVKKGLISRDEKAVWRPTTHGSRFLNDLVAEFLYAQE